MNAVSQGQTIQQQKDSLQSLIPTYNNAERIVGIRKLAALYLKDTLEIGHKIIKELIDDHSCYDYPKEAGLNFITLSSFEKRLSTIQEAIISLEKADSLFVIAGYKYGRAGVMLNMGILYKNMDKPKLSLEQYENAYSIFEADSHKIEMSSCLSNIGNYYFVLSNYQVALEYYIQALEIKESEIDESSSKYYKVANNLTSIALVQANLKQYDAAIKNYRQAYAINVKKGNLRGISRTTSKMADLFSYLMEYDSAIYYSNKCIETSKVIGNKRELSLGYSSICRVYYKMGLSKLALRNAFKSLEIQQEIQYSRGIYVNFMSIGEIYLDQGHYNTALIYFKKAENLSEIIEDKSLESNVQSGMATAYGYLKNYEKAYAHSMLYAQLTDSIFEENNSEELARMQTIYETNKKEKEILILNAEKAEQELLVRNQKAELTIQRLITIGILVFLLILVMVSFLLFNRYKLKQKAEKAELEVQSMEFESRLLRSQMNPHFIFNSLNSIQNYVLKNEKKLASSYLIKFANLMRNVLEMTRQETVSLEVDIETLRINMELEKLRLKDKFDFEILLDHNIDPESIFIPPMILQPHIENAIKHGIADIEKPGIIKVEIKLAGNLLRCSITDNGAGRKHVSQKGGKNYRSVSGKLNEERLELMSKRQGLVLEQKIIDLKDESGNAAGTMIEISIPYEMD